MIRRLDSTRPFEFHKNHSFSHHKRNAMTSSDSFISTLAVMTSGGDAPGMNAALRAVVRRALSQGLQVYGIHRGWLGAVEGGDAIEELRWESVG